MQDDSPDEGQPRRRGRDHRSHRGQAVRGNRRMGRPVTDVFAWTGEPEKKEPYPYLTCGLDNIFLLNGYRVIRHDGEEGVSVIDVDGLHKAIGRHLVLHRKGLAPKEIRFLRKAMNLTQEELAQKLGNNAQSVARWEKGTCEMPGTAEKLLRAIYLAQNSRGESDLKALRRLLVSRMDELDTIDEVGPSQAQFEFNDEWDEAPALKAA